MKHGKLQGNDRQGTWSLLHYFTGDITIRGMNLHHIHTCRVIRYVDYGVVAAYRDRFQQFARDVEYPNILNLAFAAYTLYGLISKTTSNR